MSYSIKQEQLERYERLLKLYREIRAELKKLTDEGHFIESELQRIINEEKMQNVLQQLKNINEE